MKATFDLPADLVRTLKVRAAEKGKTAKEIVELAIRKELAPDVAPLPANQFFINPKTGLPTLKCAPVDKQPTPEEIDNMLIQQEIEWLRESGNLP